MEWLTSHSRSFLAKGYLRNGEDAETRIQNIADHAEKLLGIDGFAKKFYHYMEEGYYSLASPVWSNFGLMRGLPISCFGSYVGDDMGQILFAQAEVGMMSKYGGGTSGYFGELRGRGTAITDNGVSSGSVHFMQLFESVMDVVSQGATRRGHFAPYLPIDHPDIDEFLEIGAEGNPIQELTHAVTVTDAWMEAMVRGDEDKRRVWAKVLQRRGQIGYPYILFIDTVNNNTVDVYKDKKMKIHASNLCTEVLLPSNEEWSFVCDLSSMNAVHFDTWKNTDAVATLTFFLDAVMTDFIQKLEMLRDSDDRRKQQSFAFMERAYNFAVANRALGIGVLGWHSYLQTLMLPFESSEASKRNIALFKHIKEESYKASAELARLFGEPSVLKGYGRRNATLNAVAPTTSSAFILGQVSQSIEPIWSNCYVKDIDKMKVTIKNRFLEELLLRKGENTKEIWRSIRDADGSVQHLLCLSAEEKEIFKTFSEIDQSAIIEQAAVRQVYIDQGQSLNVMINPATEVKDINRFYIDAWRMGVKTLYYQHSMNAAQQLGRQKIAANACVSCEA